MQALSIDFETRSTVDLRKTSVYPYALNGTTDIWCMAYSFGREEPRIWVPRIWAGPADVDDVGAPPARVVEHIEAGGPIRAWNAEFERVIWWCIMARRYGFPRPAREQFFDTAADAAALALPRSLNRAANVLGLDVKKDDEGWRLMLQMAKPRDVADDGTITWWDEPEKLDRLYAYCRQDVRVEQAVLDRIRPIGPLEREVYLLDQRVNDRGVMVDMPLVKAAEEVVAEGTERANRELVEITDGGVERVTKVREMTTWLQERISIPNLQKATVRDLLDGEGDPLPPRVRRVLEIRAETAKSSTAKLNSMQRYACPDHRMRGMLLYHGAGTGRWSGKGPQPQNYPRPEIRDIEDLIPDVLARDYDGLVARGYAPVKVVASMLRSMLRAAPGKIFRSADFSQIEARVLAWLAEQEDLVELFATGGKVYEEMASFIFGRPVEEIGKESFERQVGKNTVLGCGFQMGADTYARQLWEQTGIEIDRGERDEDGNWVRPDLAAKSVEGYRTRFDRIPQFWRDINDAAISAVAHPGTVTRVGRRGAVRFTVRGQFLWCVLPSGRPLAYAKPELRKHIVRPPEGADWEAFETTSATYMHVDGYTRKWKRRFAYGGLWTENVVQATARDVMALAMLRVERAGYPVVLTVHDEVLTECDPDHGSQEHFLELMHERPDWAHDLPVAAEGWAGQRYRK